MTSRMIIIRRPLLAWRSFRSSLLWETAISADNPHEYLSHHQLGRTCVYQRCVHQCFRVHDPQNRTIWLILFKKGPEKQPIRLLRGHRLNKLISLSIRQGCQRWGLPRVPHGYPSPGSLYTANVVYQEEAEWFPKAFCNKCIRKCMQQYWESSLFHLLAFWIIKTSPCTVYTLVISCFGNSEILRKSWSIR